MDEKIRFLEERKLARTIEKEKEAAEGRAKESVPFSKNATNPVTKAFLRFVHTKHKFNIEDL